MIKTTHPGRGTCLYPPAVAGLHPTICPQSGPAPAAARTSHAEDPMSAFQEFSAPSLGGPVEGDTGRRTSALHRVSSDPEKLLQQEAGPGSHVVPGESCKCRNASRNTLQLPGCSQSQILPCNDQEDCLAGCACHLLQPCCLVKEIGNSQVTSWDWENAWLDLRPSHCSPDASLT